MVKDYNYSNLKSEIEPLVIGMTDRATYLSIKFNSGSNLIEAVAHVEEEWSAFVPFKPDYKFLDQSLENLYENEQ